jgi:hypothetical protein
MAMMTTTQGEEEGALMVPRVLPQGEIRGALPWGKGPKGLLKKVLSKKHNKMLLSMQPMMLAVVVGILLQRKLALMRYAV